MELPASFSQFQAFKFRNFTVNIWKSQALQMGPVHLPSLDMDSSTLINAPPHTHTKCNAHPPTPLPPECLNDLYG